MSVDIMREIEVASVSWELSKFTDDQLVEELEMRARTAAIQAAEQEHLYRNKDVIDFDINGTPYLTEER